MKTTLLSALILLSSLAYAIPLKLVPGESDSGTIFLPCAFDGRSEACFLDTGAAHTSVVPNAAFMSYVSVGKHEAGGASGTRVSCDVIQVGELQVGESSSNTFNGLIRRDFKVTRCASVPKSESVIGIDVFKEHVLALDFAQNDLRLIDSLPAERTSYPLTVYPRGHIGLAVAIGDEPAHAFFDTGAGLTSIDQAYVNQHPEQFSFLENGSAGTAVGNSVPVKLYRAKSIRVGTREFRDLLVLALDFKKFAPVVVGTDDSDMVLILGYNIITQANWTLDLKTNRWQIE
jgi:hypothetical protein